MEAPPQIGNDERRMHVRAYNYWVSLLAGRDYPSIEDLDPAGIEDFAPNSVLLDFTCGADQATFAYLGSALRAEGEIGNDVRSIADVPRRSVLSRLTEHYLEIIANRAPIGFEAEYVNQRGLATQDAVTLIVNGFCKEVLRELPMEFAVEAQKLLGVSLEGSAG